MREWALYWIVISFLRKAYVCFSEFSVLGMSKGINVLKDIFHVSLFQLRPEKHGISVFNMEEVNFEYQCTFSNFTECFPRDYVYDFYRNFHSI